MLLSSDSELLRAVATKYESQIILYVVLYRFILTEMFSTKYLLQQKGYNPLVFFVKNHTKP